MLTQIPPPCLLGCPGMFVLLQALALRKEKKKKNREERREKREERREKREERRGKREERREKRE